MSREREQEQPWSPSSWSNHQNGTHSDSASPQPRRFDSPSNSYSSSPSSSNRIPERQNMPTRASTLGTEQDRKQYKDSITHSRSEDLNHSRPAKSYEHSLPGSLPRPSPAFMQRTASGSNSRSSSPTSSSKNNLTSMSGHSEESSKRMSVSSTSSSSSSSSSPKAPPTTVSSSSANLVSATCSSCGKAMQGPFVRALGTVFHLNCFKCMDCGDVVASKFFPIEGPEGKQAPLCERDYFRRLNLICAKCGMALRGSYITACNKKFHVEHFTCSLCSTLFGPQDSYYEHDGDVYCHFHYSTRFATKCAGCNSAILKQFVEINRNMRDECWHPECYMINKFWNVKVVSRRPTSSLAIEGVEHEEPPYVEEERRETAISLRDKQQRMEQEVYRIWTVLSAFEESSAACISDMLRQVSNGQYLDAIRMAEKFILHVEVLFATIDDLEFHFARLNLKGMSHVREARMLCRKTVELFTLLSHTQETGSRRMGMTQELLALVTGLAHYLKILIRIALTGALKLERDYNVPEAMASFLDKLHLLAVQAGNPAARRVIKGQNGEPIQLSMHSNVGTQGVTYGFRSLAPENAGESPFNSTVSSKSHPPSDLCVKCNKTVEEDCVRLGTYQRWHSHCIQCVHCGKNASPIAKDAQPQVKNGEEKDGQMTRDQLPKVSTARRPPANVGLFVYDVDSVKAVSSFGEVPQVIYCTDHAHGNCRGGFQAVQRLEQYAFLLNVALRRLYLLLKQQGVVPMSPEVTPSTSQALENARSDPYRNSADIMRMNSLHLDRKLSATARLPKRSTIVESPAGRSVAPSDVVHSQRSQETVSNPPPVQTQNVQGRSPPIPHQPSPANLPNARPQPSRLTPDAQGHILRPPFARNNTEVMIVDDSAPNSPAIGDGEDAETLPRDDGITLADIPQIMEAAQAREQQRSLPRQSSVPYVAELSELELAIVKYSALLALMRSPLRSLMDLDELLEMVEIKKGNGFWNKLFKGDKKNVKKKGVFGVPLELLVEKEGSDCMLGASRATLRVPCFIDEVISGMRQMDMSVEGIFRKNGNIKRLKATIEALDRDPASVDLTQDHPVQLAALLKKFLRDLPDPLLTHKLYRLFLQCNAIPQVQERNRLIHLLSLLLPKSHRDTLEVLFVFLKWVASFAHMDEETGSKMDLGNLATVICPNILAPRPPAPITQDTMVANNIITIMLENQDQFFSVPEEFLPILRDQEYFVNSMDLPGKEFMKKCDTYQRVKPVNGRMPASGALYNGANNGSNPYFVNPPVSPSTERGPLLTSQSPRPPGTPSYPLNSPAISSVATPRMPGEEWPPTSRGNQFPPSSRPISYVQPKPGVDQTAFTPNSNGLPVKQRT